MSMPSSSLITLILEYALLHSPSFSREQAISHILQPVHLSMLMMNCFSSSHTAPEFSTLIKGWAFLIELKISAEALPALGNGLLPMLIRRLDPRNSIFVLGVISISFRWLTTRGQGWWINSLSTSLQICSIYPSGHKTGCEDRFLISVSKRVSFKYSLSYLSRLQNRVKTKWLIFW